MRSVEEGKGEDEQSTLPIGESRIRVCSCGVVFWERNVVRRFVRSIVCVMVSEVGASCFVDVSIA